MGRRITAARRRRNTALIVAAAEATMGPLWVADADLYAAARQCARYGQTKTVRRELLMECGLLEDRESKPGTEYLPGGRVSARGGAA